jgi:hypothetical protein
VNYQVGEKVYIDDDVLLATLGERKIFTIKEINGYEAKLECQHPLMTTTQPFFKLTKAKVQ